MSQGSSHGPEMDVSVSKKLISCAPMSGVLNRRRSQQLFLGVKAHEPNQQSHTAHLLRLDGSHGRVCHALPGKRP